MPHCVVGFQHSNWFYRRRLSFGRRRSSQKFKLWFNDSTGVIKSTCTVYLHAHQANYRRAQSLVRPHYHYFSLQIPFEWKTALQSVSMRLFFIFSTVLPLNRTLYISWTIVPPGAVNIQQSLMGIYVVAPYTSHLFSPKLIKSGKSMSVEYERKTSTVALFIYALILDG